MNANRAIYILEGDIEPQTAYYLNVGLENKAVLHFKTFKGKKWGLFAQYDAHEIDLAQNAASIENLSAAEGKMRDQEWDLPKLRHLNRRDYRRSSPRNKHFIRFALTLKDGKRIIAEADTRIFQNILALASKAQSA
ncbi:MAG: hypothetical protein AB7G80_06190 [Dongiaceae bacterium]